MANHMTGVISVGVDLTEYMSQQYAPFEQLYIDVRDHPDADIAQHFERCCSFIDRHIKMAGGRVLVHCQAGISRSSTICAAYLIHHYGLDVPAAVGRVTKARDIIKPNAGFLQQLVEYERQK